jgi:hypothetical protein
VTEKTGDSRRNQDLNSTRDRHLTGPGDDIVRVLVRLTDDVERFDSMLVLQRRIIEERARRTGDADDEQLGREAHAIGLEAAGLVMRAREALDELRRLGEETGLPALEAVDRNRPSALARSERAG